MNDLIRHPRRSHTLTSRAFTLVELLIVLGIILLLIGMLIPAISQVRKSVQNVNTRQMISRLEAGVQQYYSDFGAYPGPLPNAQLLPFTATPAMAGTAALTPANLTSSENLYVALAGGLGITASGSPLTVATYFYNPTAAQSVTGPANLNPLNVKKYNAYVSVQSSETSYPTGSNVVQPTNPNGQWCVAGAGGFTGDTAVPEFLDKYTNPSPILYLRANRGAAGEADNNNTFNGDVQYQILNAQNTYCGVNNDQNAQWPIDATAYPTTSVFSQNYLAYLGNPAASTNVATAANKDGFILISAGPDGKFGTSDDITNFRQ